MARKRSKQEHFTPLPPERREKAQKKLKEVLDHMASDPEIVADLEVDYAVDCLESLVGYKIVAACPHIDEYGHAWPELVLHKKGSPEAYLRLSRDEEGNGPGFPFVDFARTSVEQVRQGPNLQWYVMPELEALGFYCEQTGGGCTAAVKNIMHADGTRTDIVCTDTGCSSPRPEDKIMVGICPNGFMEDYDGDETHMEFENSTDAILWIKDKIKELNK